MLPFLATMLALLIVALWRRKGNAVAINAVLLANWLAQVLMIRVTGEQFPWLFFIVTDYLAALMVFAIASNKWARAVISFYVVQVICHAAYGLSSSSLGVEIVYWWALTLTGWGQLLSVGGWLAYDMARGRNGAGSGASSDMARNLERVGADSKAEKW